MPTQNSVNHKSRFSIGIHRVVYGQKGRKCCQATRESGTRTRVVPGAKALFFYPENPGTHPCLSPSVRFVLCGSGWASSTSLLLGLNWRCQVLSIPLPSSSNANRRKSLFKFLRKNLVGPTWAAIHPSSMNSALGNGLESKCGLEG